MFLQMPHVATCCCAQAFTRAWSGTQPPWAASAFTSKPVWLTPAPTSCVTLREFSLLRYFACEASKAMGCSGPAGRCARGERGRSTPQPHRTCRTPLLREAGCFMLGRRHAPHFMQAEGPHHLDLCQDWVSQQPSAERRLSQRAVPGFTPILGSAHVFGAARQGNGSCKAGAARAPRFCRTQLALAGPCQSCALSPCQTRQEVRWQALEARGSKSNSFARSGDSWHTLLTCQVQHP